MNLITLLRGLLGIIILLGITFLFSNNKKKINWRLVINGLVLQIIFAVFILKGSELSNYFSPFGWPKKILEGIGYVFVLILNFTTEGSKFVFGPLAISPGNPESIGTIFAFQVLPTIIFFATLTSVLYYLGIMQKVVQAMAWVMSKVMGTSGAESLSNTANIFVGQTEAPLLIKPYIKGMTKSEILTIMVGGMATIAGGVMAAYIQLLGTSYSHIMNIPLQQAQLLFATQLLGASTMAAPAGLLISKILFPETTNPETKGTVKVPVEKNASNLIEAAAIGAGDGLKLALNVAAMLIAFIALIALLNYLLQFIGDVTGLNKILMANFNQTLNMQFLFGIILQYVGIAIGVPYHNAMQFGSLIGTKVVLNEFVAYIDLTKMIDLKQLDPKTIFMATYALCGFANFSSIAMQIGGISPLAPSRRSDIASLGLKAVLGGSLATLMTAALGGILF